MANAADRLNQLQQYIDFFKNGGPSNRAFNSPFGMETFSNSNAFHTNNEAMEFALKENDKQQKAQQMEDQDAIFKNMYSGQNGNSGQMAYVQPQNQQQNNPYAARATQLNNNPYAGSGGGQDISNSLAAMLKPKNYRVG